MNDQTNTDDYRINYHHSNVTNSSLILFYDVIIRNGNLVMNGSKLNFSLYVDVEGQCRNYTNFDITLKPCPFGFEFSSDIRKCSCAKLLQKFTEDCIIENITISRSSNTGWISLTTDYIPLYLVEVALLAIAIIKKYTYHEITLIFNAMMVGLENSVEVV